MQLLSHYSNIRMIKEHVLEHFANPYWQKMSHVFFSVGFHSIISPVPCTLLYNFIYLFPPPFQHLQPFGLIAGSFLLPEICQVLHEQMPSRIKQNNDMNDQTTQQRSLVSMLVGSTIMIIIKKHYSACIYSATNSELLQGGYLTYSEMLKPDLRAVSQKESVL